MLGPPRLYLFLSGLLVTILLVGTWRSDRAYWMQHVTKYTSSSYWKPQSQTNPQHVELTPEPALTNAHASLEESPFPYTNTSHAVTIVVATQKKDDTAWIKDEFPDWQKRIYVTDDPHAEYHVQQNRGREGMVYLTYIIDNYDNLPDVSIFHHSGRYQWHNDDPLYDGLRLLRHLQIPHILKEGYISLRCSWVLGCRVSVTPIASAGETKMEDDDATHGSFYKEAFEFMFPGEPVPEEVGATCCAQFAVSGERIRERPRSDYERYRQWLLETPLRDDLSGRVMEYAWHIIFKQPAIFCPNAQECYCRTYGLCHLNCEEEGECHSQYQLPEFSTLPNRWPEIGWDDEWRDVEKLRAEQELDFTPEDIY